MNLKKSHSVTHAHQPTECSVPAFRYAFFFDSDFTSRLSADSVFPLPDGLGPNTQPTLYTNVENTARFNYRFVDPMWSFQNT